MRKEKTKKESKKGFYTISLCESKQSGQPGVRSKGVMVDSLVMAGNDESRPK